MGSGDESAVYAYTYISEVAGIYIHTKGVHLHIHIKTTHNTATTEQKNTPNPPETHSARSPRNSAPPAATPARRPRGTGLFVWFVGRWCELVMTHHTRARDDDADPSLPPSNKPRPATHRSAAARPPGTRGTTPAWASTPPCPPPKRGPPCGLVRCGARRCVSWSGFWCASQACLCVQVCVCVCFDHTTPHHTSSQPATHPAINSSRTERTYLSRFMTQLMIPG